MGFIHSGKPLSFVYDVADIYTDLYAHLHFDIYRYCDPDIYADGVRNIYRHAYFHEDHNRHAAFADCDAHCHSEHNRHAAHLDDYTFRH